MKKYLSMLLVPAMLVSLSACDSSAEPASSAASSAAEQPETITDTAETSPETEASPAADSTAEVGVSAVDGGMTIVNPVTEYQTMDEMNAAAGTCLEQPENMAVTNEYYSVIDESGSAIAQYEFTYEGNAYTLRCAPAIFDEDISGVYIGGEAAFGSEMPEELETNGDDTCKIARWANIEGQFTLYVDDKGTLTEEEFRNLAEQFSEQTNPAVVGSELTAYYADLAGSWQDETSQRAMLTVTAAEESAHFTVSWSSSAYEWNTWEMTVNLSEDGLLYYNDCIETLHTAEEDGNETEEVLASDGSGYFSLNPENGRLYWNGAEEENCAACVFSQTDDSSISTEVMDAFSEVLDSIYGINPGSAGASLRAEEAAGAASDFLDTYGAELNADAYQTMTAEWLSGQTSEVAPPEEILSESMDSFLNSGDLSESDARTAMEEGIRAAINAAAE